MTAVAHYAPRYQNRSASGLSKPAVSGAAYKIFLGQAQRLGFDSGYIAMLMAGEGASETVDHMWLHFIANYLEHLDIQPSFDEKYRHIALAGEIASGKSTMVAQLACHMVQKNRGEELALALCENSSGAVNELLICLARIIGCPVLYIRSPQELLHELESIGRHRRFLIDLPSKPAEQLPYLDHLKNAERLYGAGILCALPRRSQLLASKDAMQIWLKYSHGWAFSFASEYGPIGTALSMASKSPRPLAYISKTHDFLEGLTAASAPQIKTLIMSAITRLNQGQSH